ncbi:MAG TPA: phosphotransferase [Caulobacteraceae bacterium]|jgi:Ser/Thr protein kinase RdoA (MazF antagonist)
MGNTTLGVTEAEYRLRFRDAAFGADLAEIVAARHGLARPLARKVEGSNLVFRTGDGDWLKISPPFFADAFEAEIAATALVEGRLPLPVPEIRHTGALEDWRYLVSAHVPGIAMGEVLGELDEADLERIAEELGAFTCAFHAVPPAGFERSFGPWPRYLQACLDDAQALHRGRGNSAEQVADIVSFLAPRRSWLEALGPPVLIHADLTDEHVLVAETGGRWRVSGVLDLADAMVAPAPLDLTSPFLSLFRGKAAPQRRLLSVAGVDLPTDDRPGALMALALQHRFMHFHDWFRAEIASGLTSVAEIAATVFPD